MVGSVEGKGADNAVILQLLGVSKSYRQGEMKNTILQDANFCLYEGEIVALVGPSGSGKSTFLQVAGLLDGIDRGQIKITDKDCTKCNDEQLTNMRLNSIGFVYQFHHLLPEFTALENLLIPQLLRGKERQQAVDKAVAIMDSLGLENKQGRLPSELSGGEQQRVAFARALINDPKLLLADEPTGNLDHENSLLVFSAMLAQVRLLGVAAVIVTHNLEIAAKCDRMMIIENHKIVNFTNSYGLRNKNH